MKANNRFLFLLFLSGGCVIQLPEECMENCIDVPVYIENDASYNDLSIASLIFGPANIRFATIDDPFEADIIIETAKQVKIGADGTTQRWSRCQSKIRYELGPGKFLLAHEIGHAFTLGHTSSKDRVMRKIFRGPILIDEEIQQVYNYADSCWDVDEK